MVEDRGARKCVVCRAGDRGRAHAGRCSLIRLIEAELRAKLDTGLSLEFDSYALDMVSRAGVVQKLMVAGIDLGVAMTAVGLTDD